MCNKKDCCGGCRVICQNCKRHTNSPSYCAVFNKFVARKFDASDCINFKNK